MITFLPYASYEESAKVLDRQRLGKQRIETYQLLRSLTGQTTGWANHPACRMWRGRTNALVIYGITICDEWTRRGYVDTLRPKIQAFFNMEHVTVCPSFPDEVHASHRANLLRKDPEHYGQFGWTESPSDRYHWPV
jgi:hypothetical protein